MERHEFEHIVGAAANALGEDAFIVVGSQAILGPYPDAPPELLRSIEVDLFPKFNPERAIEIDGALGDGSPFHAAFGYYAHGVGPETARAPVRWQDRLIPIEIPPRPGSSRRSTAYCLEPHDLVLAKCVAGRPRDWDFARQAVAANLVSPDTLMARIEDLPVDGGHCERIRRRLSLIVNDLPSGEAPEPVG